MADRDLFFPMQSMAASATARYIAGVDASRWTKTFTVCCLVTSPEAYERLREDYDKMGFVPETCEFLVCDNSKGNKFTAYEAIRAFLAEAKGKYVMIVHQDTIPLETAQGLLELVASVERADPMWGVIGNAGRNRDGSPVLSLLVDGETKRLGTDFLRVAAVDENMMLVRNGTGITLSADLEGFHLYAFDLCSVAARLGYNSYVVDHLWRHDSRGLIDDSFFTAKKRVENKMREYHREQPLPTTCTALCWTRSPFTRAKAQALSLRLIAHPVHSKAWWKLWWEALRIDPLFLAYHAGYRLRDLWAWMKKRA
jgi:hypothetical protein